MFYEPSKGHGLAHDPFKAIVAPRPIGWIGTRAADGRINLAPYSFFNGLSSRPPLVCFSSEGQKDSATFARESAEFTANLVSRDLAEKMNLTSVDAPAGISEFEFAGLTPAPCRLIAAPRVGEARASLECKVTEIYEPRGANGQKAGAFIVVGEVIGVHIDETVLKDGLFDIVEAGSTARLGYREYTAVNHTFEMVRPSWKDT